MEKGGIFWNAWSDLFQFHKNHIKEEDWDKICDDVKELEHKYKDTKATNFIPKVLVAILLELEAEQKNI